MELNYKKIGTGEPLIILHGLFGSLDNWMTLSKRFGERNEVFLLDARNHGLSPHDDEFSYEVMARDLYEFIQQHQLTNPTVLGHSMGGKTAMQFVMNYPGVLSRLIVADIAPKPYPVHHGDIIKGMFALDFNVIRTRQQADEELSNYIPEISTRQFILKNLYWKEKDRLDWKFNLPVIANNIDMVGDELANIHPVDLPTLFIQGSRSNYILESDYAAIKSIFTQADIQSMNTGHWLHAESPDEFFSLVTSFLHKDFLG
ncbi:MAG: alpha/beta fold hydrolase [Flavobacteriales bacterium]|nr:alpha/beta fold hydrolase [Flavobacteriales bacterium]